MTNSFICTQVAMTSRLLQRTSKYLKKVIRLCGVQFSNDGHELKPDKTVLVSDYST
jgi:hypothetical protein